MTGRKPGMTNVVTELSCADSLVMEAWYGPMTTIEYRYLSVLPILNTVYAYEYMHCPSRCQSVKWVGRELDAVRRVLTMSRRSGVRRNH